VVPAETSGALAVTGALGACRAVAVALAWVAAAWAKLAINAVLAMIAGKVWITIAGTRLPIASAGAAVAGALAVQPARVPVLPGDARLAVVAAEGLGADAHACVLGTRCAVAVALAGLVAVCAVLADHTAQTLTASEVGLARALP